ncbi:peptidase family M50-domain-containing protein [Pavlovales sp. CCMP2436]|nr:peptidase family M50-domain-containing protein [Pavlovales sp. CCMP2436]
MRTAQPAGGGRLLRRAAGNVHSGRRVVFALLCTLLSPAAGAHWLASSAPRADAASTVITGIATASNVVTGVGSLALVVAIHELGHFSAAVAQGITVKEFSVGFGPRIATLSPPNATFDVTLRALPLGGFVAFPRALTPEVRTEIETYQKGRREKRKKAAREARGGDGDLPAWRQLFAPFLPPPPPPPLPPLTGFAAVFAKFAPLPVATMAAELAVRQARSLVEAEAREDAELQLELAADPDDPDLLQNRPLGQQALVIGAGVFANAVLSWTLIFAAADSPAFDAGLRRGDLIVSIDGTVLQGPAETAIDAALGRIKLRIEEGGKT